MSKKAVSGMMLILLLIGMLALTFNIQPVESDWTWIGPIYIRADGSVEPDTAPISTVDNVTYTLTDNIVGDVPIGSSAIVVERDNIVVDGACYTVPGTGAELSKGIHLSSVRNVIIRNTNIKGFDHGVYFKSTSYSTVSGNNITANDGNGIALSDSSYNIISGNTITGNDGSGVGLYGLVGTTNNNAISANNITKNYYGIYLDYSPTNNISENNITNNECGIGLLEFSNNNAISRNNITDNEYGISLGYSSNNSIFGNNITKNSKGIHIWNESSDNTVYHNNFINNTNQVISRNLVNVWDDGYPSGGNYWSDHVTVDGYSGVNQDEPGSDGIGDTPYVIDENNTDAYPLMQPYRGPVRNLNTGQSYPTIQKGINNASKGDTIFVLSGIYSELVVVNKTIRLIGEGRIVTIIDGFVDVEADNVVVSGFAIGGFRAFLSGGQMSFGVRLLGANCRVSNNKIFNTGRGIRLQNSTNSVITANIMVANSDNVYLSESSNNTISQNNISPIIWKGYPQPMWYGIVIYRSSNNTIIRNNMTQCERAIRIEGITYWGQDASNNTIIENKIEHLGHNGYGIDLSHSSNNQILRNKITALTTFFGDSPGISLYCSLNNSIIQNSMQGNYEGIKLVDSVLNNITDNILTDNFYGILLEGSQVNSLIGNNVTHTPVIFERTNKTERVGYGILIRYCYYGSNKLRYNNVTGYRYNFGVEGYMDRYVQDVDDTNTVDGKPVYYWVNQRNGQIPSDAGYVAIVNSANIKVEGLNLKNNYQGILIAYSNNTIICRNNVTNNRYGTQLEFSFNNTVSENNITNNEKGVSLSESCNNNIYRNNIINPYEIGISFHESSNNTLSENNISNNTVGVFLRGSSNNTILRNYITYNYDGIYIRPTTPILPSSNNTIYHNNFINNTYHVRIYESSNTWDDGYPSGGNYWSDYTGVDSCWGPYQNVSGSDGIGDTPYVIDENNTDKHPLMSPYEYWSNPILGDINRDMKVDYKDLFTLAIAYGSTPEKPNWNPNTDINNDGRVNHKDLFILAANYGKEWKVLKGVES